MRIVCWQTILMNCYILFFEIYERLSQNVLSAAVVIGALYVKQPYDADQTNVFAGWSAPLLFVKQQNQGFSRRYPCDTVPQR